MKMQTSELQGAALDWAVARLECFDNGDWMPDYCTDWAAGGPIIEVEKITVMALEDGGWTASVGELWVAEEGGICGPTPLIAAMRCYVASKLGSTVEIPKELK